MHEYGYEGEGVKGDCLRHTVSTSVLRIVYCVLILAYATKMGDF